MVQKNPTRVWNRESSQKVEKHGTRSFKEIVSGSYPARVLNRESPQKRDENGLRTFNEVVSGSIDQPRRMKSLLASRREGGNVVVELDVDDYKKGMHELQFNIMGKL